MKIRIPVAGVKDWTLDVIPSVPYEGEHFTQVTDEPLLDKNGRPAPDGGFVRFNGNLVQLSRAGNQKYYVNPDGNYGRVRDAYNELFRKDGKWYCSWEMDDAYLTPQLPKTVVPEEGSNVWFDNVIIPKSAKNLEAAHAFINFLNDGKIAARNTEYIC